MIMDANDGPGKMSKAAVEFHSFARTCYLSNIIWIEWGKLRNIPISVTGFSTKIEQRSSKQEAKHVSSS